MVLGPRQFEFDKSGAGAVLCTWGLFLSIQAATAECRLERRPVDGAIDEAILAIDDFIVANSSLRPTREMLAEFKRRAASQRPRDKNGMPVSCSGPGARDLDRFRSVSPEQIRSSLKALLAVPREPVMNPCL
jgi:hypothetical protein